MSFPCRRSILSCMLAVAVVASCDVGHSAQPTAVETRQRDSRTHPFLLMTPESLARTRAAIASDKQLSALADALIERARGAKPESLPPLERAWWDEAKSRPWAETYGLIWHHTGVVPLEWTRMAQDAARAAVLEDDERLAGQSKQILLDLADYTFEFDHYDVGMNYTLWCLEALDAYDVLHDRFEPAQRRKMDAFFDRALAAIIRSDEYWIAHEPGGKINNHYAWHKLGQAMIGLFYDRPEVVERAIHGPKGPVEMMRHGFRDDGLWIEASIPYQLAETIPMVLMAQMLDNAGYPFHLWTHATDDGIDLKGAYDALIETAFPNRVLPPVGDCYAARPHLGSLADFEWLYARWRDPAYAWLIADHGRPVRQRRTPWDNPEAILFVAEPDLRPAAPPAMRTRLWPEHGYAALRTVEGQEYWSGRGWTVFAVYSDTNVHGNADKLSIMLFGNHHLWLPRLEASTRESQRFAAAIQRQLNRAGACQNTLVVDGHDPAANATRLELIEFAARPRAKRLVIGDLAGRLYPGVRQSRTLVARDDYVLDCFQAASAKEHDYVWMTHIDGKPVACALGQWQEHVLSADAPWKYLRNPRRAPSEGTYWEVFEHEGRRFRLDVVCDGPIEVLACDFPLDDSDSPATMPMRMIRARRPIATFTAVYQSGDQAPAEAKIELAPDVLDTFQSRITIAGRGTVHRIPRLAVPKE